MTIMQASLVLLTCSFYLCAVQSQKSRCLMSAIRLQIGQCTGDATTPCMDLCTGEQLPEYRVSSRSSCEDYAECCFDDRLGRCLLLSTNGGGADDNDYGEPDDDFEDRDYGDSSPLPITCNTNKFPYNCKTESYKTNNLQCKVNIPYCMRVPCRATISQEEVERNSMSCAAQPGCCFDEELSYYRRHFGQRILPGVPVCHWAIRNTVFQKHARKYSDMFGAWNPMLTSCLIESQKESIFGDSAGCYMVTVIEYFGLKAKVAGWKGISPLECHLIDGCFRPGKGCFYPFDPTSGIKVKANDPYKHPLEKSYNAGASQNYNINGNYRCQTFQDVNDPISFLTGYHQCLSAGCMLGPSAQNLYFKHLWNVSQTLGPLGRDPFWKGVMSYEIRADNFLDEIQKHREMYDEPDYESPILPYQYRTNQPQIPVFPGSHQFPINSAPRTQYSRGGNNTAPKHFTNPPIYHNVLPNYHRPVTSQQCVYQRPKIPNFPPLKGSFTGCCEDNLCYFPAQMLYSNQLYSQITYYYTSWSSWTICTKSCSGGSYTRVRKCVSHDHVGINHDCDSEKEVKPCNVAPCPHWTQWSEYAGCSVTCGSGLRSRRRQCIGKYCYGRGIESLPCTLTKCPFVTMWSHWSRCSSTCGEGARTRSRSCDDRDSSCPTDFKSTETGRCHIYCGKVVWGTWSKCAEQTCTMKRTPACLYGKSIGYCRYVPPPAVVPCRNHACYCRKYPTSCYPGRSYNPNPMQRYSQYGPSNRMPHGHLG